MNAALIDHYESGPQRLRQSLRGLSREDLLAYPVAGTWPIQQIVIHLQDSDLIQADRMKRIIAEDNPSLLAFDHERFALQLSYDQQSVHDALTLIELNRRQMARVLRRLPSQALQRIGTHSRSGPVTLLQVLQGAVDHLEHHLKHLLDKRARLGKPLA